MTIRQRLDLLLMDRGLADSREKAQALIMAGEVLVNGQRADKAGRTVPPDANVEVKTQLRYVSRGGLKLEGAQVRRFWAPHPTLVRHPGTGLLLLDERTVARRVRWPQRRHHSHADEELLRRTNRRSVD